MPEKASAVQKMHRDKKRNPQVVILPMFLISFAQQSWLRLIRWKELIKAHPPHEDANKAFKTIGR